MNGRRAILRKEIILALLLKLILLAILATLCFSHPTTHHLKIKDLAERYIK